MKLLQLLSIFCLLCSNSCSSGPSFDPVKGTVAVDGKPVNYGVLSISPDSTEINPGRSTTVEVFAGNFDASAVGVKLGDVKVNLVTYDLGDTVLKSASDFTEQLREKYSETKTKTYTKKMNITTADTKIEFTAQDQSGSSQ